jgi:hypothetical protein
VTVPVAPPPLGARPLSGGQLWHRGVEVARLKALGATDERGPMERDGEYWVRMNDPEGNEFCVQ